MNFFYYHEILGYAGSIQACIFHCGYRLLAINNGSFLLAFGKEGIDDKWHLRNINHILLTKVFRMKWIRPYYGQYRCLDSE